MSDSPRGWGALRLGWRGATAAVMLVAALGLHLGVVQPLAAKVELQEAAMASELAAVSHPLRADAEQARWAGLLASLPPSQGLQARTVELLQVSAARGLVAVSDVVIDTGETSPGGIVRWRVRHEIKGRYGALREMLEAALQTDPALSLDALRIAREGAEASEVRAELQWSLYAVQQGVEAR